MWAVKLLSALAVATSPILCFQVGSEQSVRQLVEAAEQSARPQPWAGLLIRADAEAATLERREQDSSLKVRLVRVADGVDLHYRWNEIQASENYQHDLLRRVVSNLQGTPPGADALAQLLGVGPCFVDYEGLLPSATRDLPLHERIIRMLELAAWRKLKDPRLLRIEAQAYETWWSLSVAAENDPELEQNGLRPAKFATGSQRARIKALRLYSIAATNRTDPEQLSRLVKLRTRHDTNQRAGFCGGD